MMAAMLYSTVEADAASRSEAPDDRGAVVKSSLVVSDPFEDDGRLDIEPLMPSVPDDEVGRWFG
jgi:hypothetical protein